MKTPWLPTLAWLAAALVALLLAWAAPDEVNLMHPYLLTFPLLPG